MTRFFLRLVVLATIAICMTVVASESDEDVHSLELSPDYYDFIRGIDSLLDIHQNFTVPEDFAEWVESLRVQIDSGRADDPWLLIKVGNVLFNQRFMLEAAEFYKAAEDIAEAQHDSIAIAVARGNMGTVHWRSQSLEEAREAREKASVRAQEWAGEHEDSAKMVMPLLYVLGAGEPKERALEAYESALRIDKETGFKRGEAYHLYRIGSVQLAQMRTVLGIAALQQSIELYETIDDEPGLADALATFLVVQLQMQPDGFMANAERCLDIYASHNLRSKESMVRQQILVHKVRTYGIDSAKSFLSTRLDQYRASNDMLHVADYVSDIAQVELGTGSFESAGDSLRKAVSIYRHEDDIVSTGATLELIGKMEFYLGRQDSACALLQDAVRILREANEPLSLVSSLYSLSFAQMKSGKHLEARTTLNELIGMYESGMFLEPSRSLADSLLQEVNLQIEESQ